MATFLECMHRAFHYIAGVPREIVFDNAKTVVAERVGGVVQNNQNLMHMAATYGFSAKGLLGPLSRIQGQGGSFHQLREKRLLPTAARI